MIRSIELRRPWGSRTSTLHCTHGHTTEVPTANAPSTCPVCDLVSADEAQQLLDAATSPNAACTGVSAGWCPIHGDCTCPRPDLAKDDPKCPLHAVTSTHAEGDGEALRDRAHDLARTVIALHAEVARLTAERDRAARVVAAHPYTEGCDCAACTDCRAILDAHVNDAELSCAEADAPRVLHVLPTPRAHQPSCTTPHNPLGWCDCTLPSEPPASHLGLLRDPETSATPEERLIERVERIDSGARIDPDEPRS